jgi:hypothetical protein
MRIKGLIVHSGQALLEGALVASLVLMLAVGTTFAAKGGHNGGNTSSSGGTLAVRMVVDNNGDNAPNWNDWITFDVSTTATTQPWVRVDCYQGGAWVYTSSAGFFSTYAWNPYFDLASTGWSSGAASCTASLYKYSNSGKVSYLAKMTFGVGA